MCQNPYLWNICVFPQFSGTMGIHFSHVLEIVWISSSREMFMKSIILECLYFPILFPHHGNSLFPCFGNGMDFWFKKNVYETFHFGILCFPILLLYHRNWLSSCIGDNTTDVKTNKKFFPFPLLRSNICISDPYAIKVWKYIEYKRVDSIFYSSARTAATIKNTHKWLLPKCLLPCFRSSCSQNICTKYLENKCRGVF